MPPYESEITHFLKTLKAERPHLEEAQKQGRAIWWDKDAIDLEQARRWKDARVPMKPYPYQSET
jgi:hypothetical protein